MPVCGELLISSESAIRHTGDLRQGRGTSGCEVARRSLTRMLKAAERRSSNARR